MNPSLALPFFPFVLCFPIQPFPTPDRSFLGFLLPPTPSQLFPGVLRWQGFCRFPFSQKTFCRPKVFALSLASWHYPFSVSGYKVSPSFLYVAFKMTKVTYLDPVLFFFFFLVFFLLGSNVQWLAIFNSFFFDLTPPPFVWTHVRLVTPSSLVRFFSEMTSIKPPGTLHAGHLFQVRASQNPRFFIWPRLLRHFLFNHLA